jgi:hypothetical protein
MKGRSTSRIESMAIRGRRRTSRMPRPSHWSQDIFGRSPTRLARRFSSRPCATRTRDSTEPTGSAAARARRGIHCGKQPRREFYRARFQNFLNSTSQSAGDLPSLPLEGEEEHLAGKRQTRPVVTFAALSDAAQAIYVVAHELVSSPCPRRSQRQHDPNDQRLGVADRYVAYGTVSGRCCPKDRPRAGNGYQLIICNS